MTISAWTSVEALSRPKRATIAVVCAAIFGASLTTYVMFMPGHPYLMQTVASCLKVPALILIGPLVAFWPAYLLARLFVGPIDVSSMIKAAFACVVGTAICLGLCAPVIAALNTLNNYTVLIFASYAAFAGAGLMGSFAFYWKLRRDGGNISSRALKVSAIWLVLFGPISAEVGWSIRPLVGWTGQPFEWFRPDSTQIWDQLNAETQNLRVGGLSFPRELEERFKK